MKIEIRYIATRLPRLSEVYGFGSAFRSDKYSDIDLLAVFDACDADTFGQFLEFLAEAKTLGERLGKEIDVTALTSIEAAAKPLRESNHFIPLYFRDQLS